MAELRGRARGRRHGRHCISTADGHAQRYSLALLLRERTISPCSSATATTAAAGSCEAPGRCSPSDPAPASPSPPVPRLRRRRPRQRPRPAGGPAADAGRRSPAGRSHPSPIAAGADGVDAGSAATATAAAPTSGPASPRPAGHDPGAGGERRGGPGRRARPGRRRRSRRRSRGRPSRRRRPAAGRAGWPPTPPPARPASRSRPAHLGPASAGGPAGGGADGGARRLGLEAARGAPQPHAAPVGLDDDVADVAGVAGGAVEQPAVEHDPAADPGRHHHGEEVRARRRRRRPSPRRGRAPWRRCRRTVGSPVSAGQPRAGAGSRRTCGDVERRHRLAAGRHRPAAPHAAGDLVAAPRPRRRPGEGGEPGLGVAVGRGVGDLGPVEQPRRAASTRPAASFVPPMSTASTDRSRRTDR